MRCTVLLSLVFFLVMIPQSFLDMWNIVELCWFYLLSKLAVYVMQMAQEWLDASCLLGFKGNTIHLLYCTCQFLLQFRQLIHSLFTSLVMSITLPSVLWRCWLGIRKGIRSVKNWVVRCWHRYLTGARCRLAYGPADATATHCLLLQ